MPKKTYAMYISEDTYNQIKEIALKEKRSVSQQVDKILSDFLDVQSRGLRFTPNVDHVLCDEQ